MAPAGIGADLEGVHAVAAAVRSGRVQQLFVEEGRLRRPEVQELVEAARGRGAEISIVADVGSRASSAAPQGVVARARPIPLRSLEELVEAAASPAVMVLDRLEDPQNVGAVARSALAAGMSGIVVPSRRAAPLGATAFKAAAGALEELPVSIVSSTADAVAALRRLGLWTVGLSGAAETSVFGLALLAEPVAVVVGAEGRGLSPLVERRVDLCVRIPMPGPTESLNASVAAALAAFEIARVRGRC